MKARLAARVLAFTACFTGAAFSTSPRVVLVTIVVLNSALAVEYLLTR